MGAATDTGAPALPSLGLEMWLTVSLAVPMLLLHPWLKADVAPTGMDFLEAVYASSSPLKQGFHRSPGSSAEAQ